jgi:hypothetical protein
MDRDDASLIARLERFCAALYRTVPLEGHGVVAQAAELAHAADLDTEADALVAGDVVGDAPTVLRPRDIQVACQLLIDVRRAPSRQSAAEVALARRHFPEVEHDDLSALEDLIGFYTGLMGGG